MTVRLVVAAVDASAAVHAGGEVERYARSFDLPDEIVEYIQNLDCMGGYVSISLALERTEQTK